MSELTICLQILDDPLVFCTTSGWLEQSALALCLRKAAGRPFYLLVSVSWDARAALPQLAALRRQAHRHPGVTLVFMCQTAADVALLAAAGLQGLHVHRNAFVDETVFRPDPAADKRFAAVHNANPAAFKRHELAWDVQPIALICYDLVGDGDVSALRGYRQIAWSNVDAAGRSRWIDRVEVARIVNQAHCGLILSELEGGNAASMEYLLCGVPVISTLSRGGRHAMYDLGSVTIVAPERAAVTAATAAAARTRVDAQEIRARALARAMPHRRRLVEWLASVSSRDLVAAAGERMWLPGFRHRLRLLVDAATGEERAHPTSAGPLDHPVQEIAT